MKRPMYRVSYPEHENHCPGDGDDFFDRKEDALSRAAVAAAEKYTGSGWVGAVVVDEIMGPANWTRQSVLLWLNRQGWRRGEEVARFPCGGGEE